MSAKKRDIMIAAQLVARLAVKQGFLPALDGSIGCVDCGSVAKHYDHRDYLKPLDVAPVCIACNVLRGKGKNRKATLPHKHNYKRPSNVLQIIGKIPHLATSPFYDKTRAWLVDQRPHWTRIAKDTGINRHSIKAIATGKSKNPGVKTVQLLADYMLFMSQEYATPSRNIYDRQALAKAATQ